MTDLESKLLTIIDTLSSSPNFITLKLSAWPYSRKIISAVCKENNIEFEVKRVSKDHEEFKIYISNSDVKNIRLILKYIHKIARIYAKENNVKYTESRNIVVNNFIKENFLNQDEVEQPKKIIKVKESKNVKVVDEKTIKIKITKEDFKKAVEQPKNIVSNKNPGIKYIKNCFDKIGVQKWKLKG